MCASKVKPALSADSDCTVAIATVHWFVSAGFKRHFGILSALGTFYREHLTLRFVAGATVSITLCFPCLSTGRAAPRLVSEALASKKLLLGSGKGELYAAIGTLD
jgi:hypothetical protein